MDVEAPWAGGLHPPTSGDPGDPHHGVVSSEYRQGDSMGPKQGRHAK